MMRKGLTMLSLALTVLSGCATIDTKGPVLDATEEMKKGPENKPFVSITNFSHGLRCMDDTMIVYGVRDLSVLVEDLVDNTKKVSAGTKDMLISAVSDMSRRSRGVRLVTFGADSSNLANFLFNAEAKDAYSAIPEYDIRGSITQLDENVAKKQVDGAINLSKFGIGAAATGGTSILGLDLTMISTRDYSVVPGVTARNSAIIFKSGKGLDGEAEFAKLGISFSLSLVRNEGQAQALRTLVELSAIELFGKITKTPYWKCLGADENNEAIRAEMYDWHYSMVTSGEIVPYMQKQLRLRGYYNGPADGTLTPEFADAVSAYRQALGLSPEPTLDLAFFTAYLAADHRAVVAKFPPPEAGTGLSQSGAVPMQLLVGTANGKNRFRAGEPIDLVITTNRDAHVYCYLQDEGAQVQRFYPNRFRSDSLVQASRPLRVPGDMRFQIVANDKGVKETVACFATDRDVLPRLSPTVAGADFENLADPSLDRVRSAFAAVSGGTMAEGYFNVEFE